MRKNRMRKFHKKIIVGIVIFIILGFSAYLAADRYLIRHVEIANVSAYTGVTLTSTPSQRLAATPETITADDWHYASETISISIKQITTGSGNKKLTYYDADVVLTDATQLGSAFADDQFGRNIIEYTSQIAQANNTIFAINGDYYGFRSDGIEIRNGIVFRDKPARMGVAFYLDGSMKIYDETQTSAQE
jgi:exopolysaccharide biosynthesis protein